ncbi:hypothetical protein RHMOL_Rhmol12G0025200 [Rhododendron molle]|uniref:Uncharacterized protein n=1 Tax=Rhododendron molle TaxID=49168 RepID=A0ACC0LDZ3_RHOML|nr:hypothetical protein RHMOL_Rhmol12G0025200 [Rhododendron molle]
MVDRWFVIAAQVERVRDEKLDCRKTSLFLNSRALIFLINGQSERQNLVVKLYGELIKSIEMHINLCQEDYNRLRPLSYRGGDVFLLAFSVISMPSFENISKKWVPELRHYAPLVPIVLVGTKMDLREDKQFQMDYPSSCTISTAQGEELKKQIRAVAYLECSSKTQQGEIYTTGLVEDMASLFQNKYPIHGFNEGCALAAVCGLRNQPCILMHFHIVAYVVGYEPE